MPWDLPWIQNGKYAVTDVRPWAMVLVVDPAVKNAVEKEMKAKIRKGQDKVTEQQFAIPGTNQHVYLLSFVLPINID